MPPRTTPQPTQPRLPIDPGTGALFAFSVAVDAYIHLGFPVDWIIRATDGQETARRALVAECIAYVSRWPSDVSYTQTMQPHGAGSEQFSFDGLSVLVFDEPDGWALLGSVVRANGETLVMLTAVSAEAYFCAAVPAGGSIPTPAERSDDPIGVVVDIAERVMRASAAPLRTLRIPVNDRLVNSGRDGEEEHWHLDDPFVDDGEDSETDADGDWDEDEDGAAIDTDPEPSENLESEEDLLDDQDPRWPRLPEDDLPDEDEEE